MAESFAFELKLVDSVSKSADKAADAVRSLGSAAKKTQQSLDFSKDLEKQHAALKKLEKDPGGYVKMLKVQRELAEQRKKLASAAGVGKESFTEALGSKLSFGKMFGAAALADVLVEGAAKVGEGLIEAATKVVEIFTEGIGKAFEESGKEETRRLQFRLSLGEKEGKEALEDIERFSKLTKFTPEQIAPSILKLRKAGFSQESAQQTFATGADIEATGGMSASDFAGLAVKLKAKEGVTKKMLVDILGETGDSIPKFYKRLGKEIGVSAKTAEKMASEGGKIDPQRMLNLITASVNARQGGAAGTGGKMQSETFEARWAKLKDLPNQFFKRLVDNPGFQRASDMLGSLLSKLDPDSESGQRIMASLNSMFGDIANKIGDISVDTIVDGIEDAISAAKDFLPVITEIADIAGDLADFAIKAASGFKLMMAVQSGDKAAINAAAVELGMRGRDKAYRQQERDAKKAGYGNGPLLDYDVTSPLAAAPQGKPMRNVTVNNSHTVNVSGGDVDAIKSAVEEGHRRGARHLNRELERANTEGTGN